MDFSALKKRCGLNRIRGKSEAGPSQARPTTARAASESIIVVPSSITPTIVQLPYSAPTSPTRRRQPPRSPIARAMIATFGPTMLRSVLPRRESSLPSGNRHGASTASTASTSSTLTQEEIITPTSTFNPQASRGPPSPCLAHAGHTPLTDSPLDRSPLDPNFAADAPLMVQKATFSPALLPIPSPCSQYGGEAYTRSPCLSHFALGTRALHRPSITSLYPTSDNAPSPSSIGHFEIVALAEPEPPVVSTAQFTTFRPSRASFVRLAEHRPIALDLSAATRKPKRDKGQGTSSPLSPRFARLASRLVRSTTPASPRRPAEREEVNENPVLGEGDEIDHRPINVLQWVLDSPHLA